MNISSVLYLIRFTAKFGDFPSKKVFKMGFSVPQPPTGKIRSSVQVAMFALERSRSKKSVNKEKQKNVHQCNQGYFGFP